MSRLLRRPAPLRVGNGLTPPAPGLAIALIVFASGGCGYSSRELYPADVRTVAVPLFENRTFYREMEASITEAVIKEIERRTPYKVVRSGDADTLLRGVITGVSQRQISRTNFANLPQELELRVAIDFTWSRTVTGETIRERRGYETVSRYVPTRPVGEPLPLAQREAAERIAQDLVGELREDW